jgi:3-phenylpropionate/trans-cinnamate dioxygenase ferredoxin component
MNDKSWHRVCRANEIEAEDVIGVTLEGAVYAVYRLKDGFYATEGLCTHEQSPLAGGYVSGDVIECAKHNARYHIPTGKALRRPALRDLATFPVKREGEYLFIGLPRADEGTSPS